MKTETNPNTDSLTLQELEEKKAAGGRTPVFLWLVSLVFVVTAFLIYQKISGKHVDPPPPPVNVKSMTQVNRLLYEFADALAKGDWDKGTKLLTQDAQHKLTNNNKTLQDSLLANRKTKEGKILTGTPTTEEPEVSETAVRHNMTFYFDNKTGDTTYTVPITVIKEVGPDGQDRLAISDWGNDPTAKPSPSGSPSPSPAKK